MLKYKIQLLVATTPPLNLPLHHTWNNSFLLVLLASACQYLQMPLLEHRGHKQCGPT